MGPFQRYAIAARHRAVAPPAVVPRSRRGSARLGGGTLRGEPLAVDHETGQALRGLLVGLPIGLAIWALFALIVWRIV